MLGFCRTLEIIARTLHEVVNRVRLCGHHTRGRLRGEVHVYGAMMRRWGEGGDWCIDSVLKTPEERELGVAGSCVLLCFIEPIVGDNEPGRVCVCCFVLLNQ